MHAGRSLQLSRDAVHIWTMPTHAPEAVVAQFGRVLAADEVQRASGFRFNHLRDSFVIAHGVLRYLLARYLGLSPTKVCFVYGDKGKPNVASEIDLHFNLTHSDDVAVIAFAADCQVGIDVEHLRPLADMPQIADHCFNSEEAQELMLLPASEREHAFFRCWTRKEAYIKAIGDGLSCALDSFRVTLLPDVPPRLVHIGGDTAAADMWTLHDLNLAPDYAAALAYREQQRTLTAFPILDFSEFINI